MTTSHSDAPRDEPDLCFGIDLSRVSASRDGKTITVGGRDWEMTPYAALVGQHDPMISFAGRSWISLYDRLPAGWDDFLICARMFLASRMPYYDPERSAPSTFIAKMSWFAIKKMLRNEQAVRSCEKGKYVRVEYLEDLAQKTATGEVDAILDKIMTSGHLASPEDDAAEREIVGAVLDAVAAMPEGRARRVVAMRIRGDSFGVIGESMGFTRQRAAQIFEANAAGIRAMLEAGGVSSGTPDHGPSFARIVSQTRVVHREFCSTGELASLYGVQISRVKYHVLKMLRAGCDVRLSEHDTRCGRRSGYVVDFRDFEAFMRGGKHA